ncbi:hypothetical protein GCM10027599_09380 [Yimella radicis]
MPDELKVDVDQEKLQAWDDAKGDYGVDDGERPIMVGEGEAGLTDETDSIDEADSTDENDSTDEEQGQHHTSRPDRENRSSAEPTDGQQT